MSRYVVDAMRIRIIIKIKKQKAKNQKINIKRQKAKLRLKNMLRS